jgi:predicted DNA-binding transcriptional regulator AlpA
MIVVMAKSLGARARALDYISRQSGVTLDSAGAASLLGVTRSHVNRLAIDDRTFPRPFTTLAGSRYWWRSGIELWASLHRRSRHEAHGSFGREAARLLELAEAAASDLRHSGVGDIHFWLALVDRAAPGVVPKVLGSMGVDRGEVMPAVLRALPVGEDDGYPPGLRMNAHVQQIVGRAARHSAELRTERIGAAAIALSLLDEWPVSRDMRRPGGGPVTWWLFRRGLDVGELRRRIARCAADPGAAAQLDRTALPKRRPPKTRRRPSQLRELAPNPLGHDPWERHPWGSTFARRTTGKSWVEDGRQYFFFYDRDRYRIRTADGRPVGYWWQIEPRPKPGRRAKGSKGAVVLPAPSGDVEWPERLAAINRDQLLARRSRRALAERRPAAVRRPSSRSAKRP